MVKAKATLKIDIHYDSHLSEYQTEKLIREVLEHVGAAVASDGLLSDTDGSLEVDTWSTAVEVKIKRD